MKQYTIVFGVLVALACAIGVVRADNPHFVHQTTATLVGTSVQVCWKEAGLDNNLNITYVASANASATYNCVNNGGQCPDAANKMAVTGPVSATGTFSSGDNGQITQCLTISLPAPPQFCPPGQVATLANFSYSGIQVTDTTTNAAAGGITDAAKPSALSATVFVCPGP